MTDQAYYMLTLFHRGVSIEEIASFCGRSPVEVEAHLQEAMQEEEQHRKALKDELRIRNLMPHQLKTVTLPSRINMMKPEYKTYPVSQYVRRYLP